MTIAIMRKYKKTWPKGNCDSIAADDYAPEEN